MLDQKGAHREPLPRLQERDEMPDLGLEKLAWTAPSPTMRQESAMSLGGLPLARPQELVTQCKRNRGGVLGSR